MLAVYSDRGLIMRLIQPRSRSIAVDALLLASVVALSGCGGGRSTADGTKHFVDVSSGRAITAHSVGRDPVTIRQPGQRPLPLPTGDSAAGRTPSDRMATAETRRAGQNRDPSAQPVRAPMPAPSPAASRTAPAQDAPTRIWAIVLDTVTADDVNAEAGNTLDHRALAEQRLALYRAAAPQLRGAWIHSDERGSRILVGQFRGLNDPAAPEQLRIVKTIEVERRYPFLRSLLAPIDLSSGRTAIHRYDLRQLRRQFPKVRPLYTLDVAAWIAPDDDPRAWAESKRSAEAYAAQLRAAGYEAWFYHDETAHISSVTVGKFDRRIINSQSGLYGPEARRLMSAFPVRLVNGEELLLARTPDGKTMKPQESHMVEVPLNLR